MGDLRPGVFLENVSTYHSRRSLNGGLHLQLIGEDMLQEPESVDMQWLQREHTEGAGLECASQSLYSEDGALLHGRFMGSYKWGHK